MKKSFFLLTTLVFFLLFSCSDSDDPEPNLPDIQINSYNPPLGLGGDQVIITGQNFNDHSDLEVLFGNEKAAILSKNATELIVEVPDGSGNVSIKVIANDEEITVGNFEYLEDTKKYLAFTLTGNLYEITDRTATAEKVGGISEFIQPGFVFANSIIKHVNYLYSINYVYEDVPVNYLYKYNLTDNTYEKIKLSLPETITGDERALFSLTYDEHNNRFIGIVDDHLLVNNTDWHIIYIDENNFSVTDSGLVMENKHSFTSTYLLDQNLYLFERNSGNYSIINLNDLSVQEENLPESKALLRVAEYEPGQILAMQASDSGFKPIIFSLSEQSIEDISVGLDFILSQPLGNGYSNDTEYVNEIRSADSEPALLIHDFDDSYIYARLIDGLDDNVIIIGEVPL